MIDRLHEARTKAMGLVINGAAYAHTSIALMDDLGMSTIQIYQVHMPNVFKREASPHRELSRSPTLDRL